MPPPLCNIEDRHQQRYILVRFRKSMSLGKGVLAVHFKSIYLFYDLKTKFEWQRCFVCQSTDAIVGQHQDFLLINNTLIFIPRFYFEKVLIKLSQAVSIIDMKNSHYLNKFSESFVYNLYDKVQHTPDDDAIK